jgi:hypothetical protein
MAVASAIGALRRVAGGEAGFFDAGQPEGILLRVAEEGEDFVDRGDNVDLVVALHGLLREKMGRLFGGGRIPGLFFDKNVSSR